MKNLCLVGRVWALALPQVLWFHRLWHPLYRSPLKGALWWPCFGMGPDGMVPVFFLFLPHMPFLFLILKGTLCFGGIHGLACCCLLHWGPGRSILYLCFCVIFGILFLLLFYQFFFSGAVIFFFWTGFFFSECGDRRVLLVDTFIVCV